RQHQQHNLGGVTPAIGSPNNFREPKRCPVGKLAEAHTLPKRTTTEKGRRFPAKRGSANRRTVLLGGLGLLATGTLPFLAASSALPRLSRSEWPLLAPYIADDQRRPFPLLSESTNAQNGLARDRSPSS